MAELADDPGLPSEGAGRQIPADVAALELGMTVEVRSANGRSWIKAHVSAIEPSPQPGMLPLVSVRCSVGRKRRQDGRPHIAQWRTCPQEPERVEPPPLEDGGIAGGRGQRARKRPKRYEGVEWTDMANVLLGSDEEDSDDGDFGPAGPLHPATLTTRHDFRRLRA